MDDQKSHDGLHCALREDCQVLERLQREVEQCQRDIGKLYTAEAQQRTRLDSIETLIERMDVKLDRLINKPSARWETLIGALIGAIAAYLVTALLG